MRMSPEELGRRLEEAARMRRILRRASLEMREFGRRLLEQRTRGPLRPRHGRSALR